MVGTTLLAVKDIQIKRRDFDALCSLVHNLAGIKLTESKSELVRARLSKRMRILGIFDLGEYLRFVEKDSTQSELTLMLDSLSTNLTSFFREKDHFDFVRTVIMPEIAARANHAKESPVRVWSAGCSTGEEPYTIAICILEHLPN